MDVLSQIDWGVVVQAIVGIGIVGTTRAGLKQLKEGFADHGSRLVTLELKDEDKERRLKVVEKKAA